MLLTCAVPQPRAWEARPTHASVRAKFVARGLKEPVTMKNLILGLLASGALASSSVACSSADAPTGGGAGSDISGAGGASTSSGGSAPAEAPSGDPKPPASGSSTSGGPTSSSSSSSSSGAGGASNRPEDCAGGYQQSFQCTNGACECTATGTQPNGRSVIAGTACASISDCRQACFICQ